MTRKPATSGATPSTTPGASETPKRHRRLLGWKKKETPPPPKTTTTAAITDLPGPDSQPSELPVDDSELGLSVAELRSTCNDLERIIASCRGTLEPKLWDQAIVISPSKIETADSLCQWLALASSKRDRPVSSGQPQRLRKQILSGMDHAIKATAPTLKSVLALGVQLSAVVPCRYWSYMSRFPYLRHWVPYVVQHLLLLKYETPNLPANEIGYRERLGA